MKKKPSKKKQIANRKLAVRISGNKDVEIKYGKGPYVEDARRISIPYRGVNYEEMLGLLAHEAGHIGYGSFSVQMRKLSQYLGDKYGLSAQEAMSLINVIEDCRINRINAKFYPGFYRPLREIEKKNLKELRRRYDFFTQLGLYMEEHIKYFPYEIDEEKLKLAKDLIWNSFNIGSTVLASDLIGQIIAHDKDEVLNEQGKMGDIKSEGRCNDDKNPINKPLEEMVDRMKDLSEEDVEDMAKEIVEKKEEEKERDKLKPISPSPETIEEPTTYKSVPKDIEGLFDDFNRWIYEVVKYPEPKKAIHFREEDIDPTKMSPIGASYDKVVARNKRAIDQLRQYFKLKKRIPDKMHKSGRLNNTWIKAIVSDYKFPFTRDWEAEKVKITLMVDISGSMHGSKMEAAREAMIVFAEGLQDVADLRIVLFCGTRDPLNIVVKDFGEKTVESKFNAIGNRQGEGENLDGRSLLLETEKNPKGTIIVFSDGQPAGSGYGLSNAIKEFAEAKPKLRSLWNFSIDAHGDYLEQLYDKNYVEVSVRNRDEFVQKFLKLGRMIVDCLE